MLLLQQLLKKKEEIFYENIKKHNYVIKKRKFNIYSNVKYFSTSNYPFFTLVFKIKNFTIHVIKYYFSNFFSKKKNYIEKKNNKKGIKKLILP